jgi:hypothetical protein
MILEEQGNKIYKRLVAGVQFDMIFTILRALHANGLCEGLLSDLKKIMYLHFASNGSCRSGAAGVLNLCSPPAANRETSSTRRKLPPPLHHVTRSTRRRFLPAFFRLPLRRAAEDLGCKGLMVANFATASVGLVDCIARVGPQRLPSLVVDILARGSPPGSTFQVPLEAAVDLVLAPAGSSPAAVPAASLTDAPSASASPASPLRDPALDIDLAPVRDTVWRAPSPVLEPRCSSRLISAAPKNFISIIDKAIMRKKGLNEGTSEPPKRQGELCAEDLLAVAVEDGRPLHPGDAQDLARACDIPEAALGLPAVWSDSDP